MIDKGELEAKNLYKTYAFKLSLYVFKVIFVYE